MVQTIIVMIMAASGKRYKIQDSTVLRPRCFFDGAVMKLTNGHLGTPCAVIFQVHNRALFEFGPFLRVCCQEMYS